MYPFGYLSLSELGAVEIEGIAFDLHDCLFAVFRNANAAFEAAARIPDRQCVHSRYSRFVFRVELFDQALDRLSNLDLVGVSRHFERVLPERRQRGSFLVEQRANDDV